MAISRFGSQSVSGLVRNALGLPCRNREKLSRALEQVSDEVDLFT